MPFVTYEEIQTFLKLSSPGSEQEKLLKVLMVQIPAAINNYCRRDLEYAEATEKYTGDDTDELILKRWPVISITSIVYTDEYGTETEIDSGDYQLDDDAGIIIMKPTASYETIFLSASKRGWAIKYKAGYTEETCPQDLKLACLTWIGIINEKMEHDLLAVQSTSIGDQNISYLNEDVPNQVKALLEKYERKA